MVLTSCFQDLCTCSQNYFNNMKSDYIADNNEDYKSQEYWETRFLKEESYEWLVPLSEVATQLLPLLKK